jgi:ABC-2 type transport system permease protein
MVELAAGGGVRGERREIPASTQLVAVAWLRWRMFVNSLFRRRTTAAREAMGIVLGILLRLIVWPMLAATAIGPIAGSAYFAWAAIAENHPQRLAPLLAGITLLWQFVAINGLSMSATTSGFDPSSLARFPLRFGRYLVLRTLIGLMTPSTIIGCLALLAAAAGIGVADSALALPALVVLAVYALANIFLTRMIGAWLERWLANRRFREFFAAAMALVAVGFQFLNLQRTQMHGHGPGRGLLLSVLNGSDPYLPWLPPGFAANAILHVAHPFAALAQFSALLATTALFAGVFAIRLHAQFLGEHLSEGPGKRGADKAGMRERAMQRKAESAAAAAPQTARPVFPPVIAAVMRKEWITLRGNSGLFVSLLTPPIFVAIFYRSPWAQNPSYALPIAVGYTLMGILAGLYNAFGADGLGVQVYLLAPVRMRDVIVGKNLMSLILMAGETALVWAIITALSRHPIPLPAQVSAACWTVLLIAANLAAGTVCSIKSPRRFVPGQMQRRRSATASRTSGLLVLLVLFGCMALEFPVVLLGQFLGEPWLAAWIFGPLAAGAVLAYAVVLENAAGMILKNRDVFAEELCKV